MREAARDVLGLIDIGAEARPVEADVARSSSAGHTARGTRRDDPIALPSTWVVARIAGRAG
jgi:hypothetical protein